MSLFFVKCSKLVAIYLCAQTNEKNKQTKTNVSSVEILFDWRRVGLTRFFWRSSLFDDFYKCLHRYHLFAFQTTACINCSVRFECWKKCVLAPGTGATKTQVHEHILSDKMKIVCVKASRLDFLLSQPQNIHFILNLLTENGTNLQAKVLYQWNTTFVRLFLISCCVHTFCPF